MIKFLTTWSQGIIVAVIIATIIEMILPNGNLKKYVKVVIGIYILFSIVSPIIEKMSSKTDFNNIVDISKYENKIEESDEKILRKIESNNNRTIKDIYLENLESDIKNRLQQKNFYVDEIAINIKDDKNYTITKIQIKASIKNDNSKINEIDINIGKEKKQYNHVSEEEKIEIKKYLSEYYNLSEDKIIIV